MTEVNDRLAWHRFLKRVFIADSGVSSRRVLAFMFSITMIFLMFFNYNIEYVKITGLLITGLLSLTTISNVLQKDKTTNNESNG